MSAHQQTATQEREHWDASRYERSARFVSDYGAKLIDWLNPQPGERVLDVGCGDGVLSLQIAERGAQVHGVDSSPALVEAARQRGVDAVVGDGQAIEETGRYDAVFSNAALHWMSRDPRAVLDGVAWALVPGGRFVAEVGAQGNVAPIHTALREAWTPTISIPGSFRMIKTIQNSWKRRVSRLKRRSSSNAPRRCPAISATGCGPWPGRLCMPSRPAPSAMRS